MSQGGGEAPGLEMLLRDLFAFLATFSQCELYGHMKIWGRSPTLGG